MSRFADLREADYALPDELLARTLSPALVVDLDRVRENVRRVVAYAGGTDRWRPHVKTTKIPEVWGELARAGLERFKCATTREADVLAEVLERECFDRSDVLVAYPLVGPALERLARIARAHPGVRFSVLCEDPSAVDSIDAGLGIFVDVNPGMNRTGIPLAERDRILGVARHAAERFRGVHYYDGHLHEADLESRRREIFACYDALLELRAELLEGGCTVDELITSGTPSFLHALAYPGFESTNHRVSPGTVVFHDLRSEEENPDLDLVPAAVVLARVVSHPTADIVTCDAGSKALAAEAGDPCAFVLGHPELVASTPNEEHLPLHVTRGEQPARGTPLYLVPRHVCPTINLAEEAVLLEHGSEPRVVRVSARAHELALA